MAFLRKLTTPPNLNYLALGSAIVLPLAVGGMYVNRGFKEESLAFLKVVAVDRELELEKIMQASRKYGKYFDESLDELCSFDNVSPKETLKMKMTKLAKKIKD